MNEEKINIKNGSLFPWHFRAVAVGLVVTSIALILTNLVVAIILLIIGVLMLTGYSGVSINKSQKTYREYNSFLFLKIGETKSFQEVEKIFVNASSISQKVYTAHTNNSTTFKSVLYDGYLKFGNGVKIHLLSSKDKNGLINDLKEAANFLKAEIHDNTLNS